VKFFDPAEITAPGLRILGHPDVDLTRKPAERGQLAWSVPTSAGLWQAWQGAATAWCAGRVRYAVLSIPDEEELQAVQEHMVELKKGRVDLKMPEPKDAARVRFSAGVQIRVCPDLALLVPARAPAALLLLADDRDDIKAWCQAYASSPIPCRARMPRRLPTREVRPPMRQTSFIQESP
jgi:hypothetical protein